MPRLCVELVFKSAEAGGRKSLPVIWKGYRPHFVVDDGEYLGVEFVDGPQPIFEQKGRFLVDLIYHPRVDYSPLAVGVNFDVREGARTVATGTVIDGPST